MSLMGVGPRSRCARFWLTSLAAFAHSTEDEHRMSSYFRRQLADYVEYHRDPWNCAMHVFGIVFLFQAAVLPLSLWSVTLFGIQTSAAAIAVVPVLDLLVSARLRARSRDPRGRNRVALNRCRDRQSCDDRHYVVTYGRPDCHRRRIADYWTPRVRAAAAGAGRQSDPPVARTNVCHGKIVYCAGLSARSRHHYPRASARCCILISNSSA